MKTIYWRDASTALNWADENDRVFISQNLRTNAEVLAAEIMMSKVSAERRDMLDDLSRTYTRLAVCDMDAASKAERHIGVEMQKDTLCRITLEKMADMLEEPCDGQAMARSFLEMGQRFARVVRDEKLADWFSTGPYSGLGRLALTVAEVDLEKALKEREAFSALIQSARMIPLEQSVDAEEIEAQIFRDGLKLFRRHQGLEKYDHEK